MSDSAVRVEHVGAVAWVWLDRPEVHNAFDAALIAQLTDAFDTLGQQGDVRVIVLAARGKSFSAGAQVEWMKQQGAASVAENVADARLLANMFRTIAECPKPTVARVQGAAIGGGVGLVCACDIAIGSTQTAFSTSEVRLGLIPATIAPYVIRAIGRRHAGRLFLTGERITGVEAAKMGLLHDVVDADDLDARVHAVTTALLAGGPQAQAAAKTLVRDVAGQPMTAGLIADTARRIAEQRATPEAAEGLTAFLEKRPAAWVPRA